MQSLYRQVAEVNNAIMLKPEGERYPDAKQADTIVKLTSAIRNMEQEVGIADRIFSAAGDARLQLVLMMVIDIAVYHIFSIHNPQKLSQLRKDRYDRAVEWMKAVAAEDISIEGAPLLPEEQRAAHAAFRIHSNPKRTNHW